MRPVIALAVAVLAALPGAGQPPADDLRRAVTFYCSFDEDVRADVAGGGTIPNTRFNHPSRPGEFVVEPGFNDNVFTYARNRGVSGGALEVRDVLPRNGRIFFPAKGNVAFDPKGWGGAVSVWCQTDPNTRLSTKFCDPIQITEKGAHDGGLWFDFNDAKPRRDLRHGAFPALAAGTKAVPEDDPQAPLVRVPRVDWRDTDWHHVVLSWSGFDTGKADAVSELYIDGKRVGAVRDRALAMKWDVDRAGIYVAVNYIGLLDELAVFRRPLTEDEVRELHRRPGALKK